VDHDKTCSADLRNLRILPFLEAEYTFHWWWFPNGRWKAEPRHGLRLWIL